MLNVTAASSKAVRSVGFAGASGHSSARGSSSTATTARGSLVAARAANKNDLESTRRTALSVGLGASLAALFPKTGEFSLSCLHLRPQLYIKIEMRIYSNVSEIVR